MVDALPKMAEASSSPDLKQAFKHHLDQAKQHAARLDKVFSQLGKEPERETCKAMNGLIAEGEEMISAKGDPSIKDAAQIASAQRVERTLDEEVSADHKLTQIAEQSVNVRALS